MVKEGQIQRAARRWLAHRRDPRVAGINRLLAFRRRVDAWDRWLTTSSSPLLAGLVVAAVVLLSGLVMVVILPEFLAWLLWSHIEAGSRTAWTDSLRNGLLGVLTLGAVAAWVIQYRQAAAARLVDDYNRCVRQLSQDTWEQIGGIRDLEQMATKNDQLRRRTLQMLAVFIRDSAPRTDSLDRVSTVEFEKDGPRGKRRPGPSVQEALRVIGDHLLEWAPQPHRTKEDQQDAYLDIHGGEVDTGGANSGSIATDADVLSQENYISLADIAIDGAVLRSAGLVGLNLRRSLLRDAKLEGADLSSSKLRGAVLADADLERATLIGASMGRAKLNRADLNRADLSCANLKGADLRGADLRMANLAGANLAGANVEGAHLCGVVGSSEQLGRTIGAPHCRPEEEQCMAHA